MLTCVQHTNSYSSATHKVWLACFLLACSTWRIAHVQYTKYGSRALHEFYSRAARFVSHACADWVTRQKLKTMRVLGARECQLRHELYHNKDYHNWSNFMYCYSSPHIINILHIYYQITYTLLGLCNELEWLHSGTLCIIYECMAIQVVYCFNTLYRMVKPWLNVNTFIPSKKINRLEWMNKE